MTLQATVSMSWVQTVLGEARRQGLSEHALLTAAGIRPAELTEQSLTAALASPAMFARKVGADWTWRAEQTC